MLTAAQIEQVYEPALLRVAAAVKQAEIDLTLAQTNLSACREQYAALCQQRAADLKALQPREQNDAG